MVLNAGTAAQSADSAEKSKSVGSTPAGVMKRVVLILTVQRSVSVRATTAVYSRCHTSACSFSSLLTLSKCFHQISHLLESKHSFYSHSCLRLTSIIKTKTTRTKAWKISEQMFSCSFSSTFVFGRRQCLQLHSNVVQWFVLAYRAMVTALMRLKRQTWLKVMSCGSASS